MLSKLMRRSDAVYLTIIVAIGIAIRIWAPWSDVFGSTRVNFLETDAWYHVRLLENQVKNYPHHVTVDPYAGPGGQYVAVAPLLDTITATAIFFTRGSQAPTAYIERVAALVPPLMGIATILAVWAVGVRAFGRREGLIAAFLVSFYPGHFLDRSLVGFVDHHALETMLAFAALGAFCGVKNRRPYVSSAATGAFIALYMLGWTSGAFLAAIFTLWIATVPFLAKPQDAVPAAQSAAIAAAVALALVWLFQDPHLYRYQLQIVSLVIMLTMASAIAWGLPRIKVALNSLSAIAIVAGIAAALYGIAYLAFPGMVSDATVDFMRLTPDRTRMSVMEARPLFLYSGNWNWMQPWAFFRSGFYLGIAGTLALAWTLRTSRRSDHWLIVFFTAAMYAATVGQNRFGYYLVPATTIVIGWLAARVLDWGGVPHVDNPSPKLRRPLPFQREIAVILVAGLAVAPNIVPAVITTARAGGMPDYWFEVMQWLRTETPPPFGDDNYYYARYSEPMLKPSYTVMSWWDQGYWILQTAHRVPVANPTQAAAGTAAAFFLSTDDREAQQILKDNHSRFVVVDYELPFREIGGSSTLGGRFENLVNWGGHRTAEYYSTCFVSSPQGWQPQWIFREPYYQSMVYRLMVLGGVPVMPTNNTWVVKLDTRIDVTGRQFCELSDKQRFATVDEARAAAKQKGPGHEVVGLTPWQPAFNVGGVSGLHLVKDVRRPGQVATEAPFARIFATTPLLSP